MKYIRKTSDFNQTLLRVIEEANIKLVDAFIKRKDTVYVRHGIDELQICDGTKNTPYDERLDTVAKNVCYIIEVQGHEGLVEKAIKFFAQVQTVSDYNKTTPYKIIRKRGDEVTRGFVVRTISKGYIYVRTIEEAINLI